MAIETETPTQETTAFEGTEWNREKLDALVARIIDSEETVGEPMTVHSPSDGEQIGEIPRLGEQAVDDAVARAREAADEWAERPFSERVEVLDRFADLVEQNQGELLDLIQLETGKARIDALEEMIDPPMAADYYAEHGPDLIDDEPRDAAFPLVTSTEVVYDPVGVVGIISPWNYPLSLSFIDAIPALFAGNGVVIKPDDKTPFTALRLAELFIEAGLPEDLCAIVTGEGPTIGESLIERVNYVTFTGSTDTGRIVAEQAGRHLIDCSLELSGKNPMLILEDADVEMAVRGAIQACFTNAGQICLSAERIYVEEPLYEEFLDELVAQTEDLTLGASFDYGPDVGSIINEEQLERVASHVEDARERGATVRVGGERRPDIGPYFYEPTVLTDVPGDSLPSCEETFGPVITVEPVDSVEEGIEEANDSTHGLNASVWTTDLERGQEIAREIECGTVGINDGYAVGYAAADAPMGGMKDSGIGRRHGTEGLNRFVEPKTIATSRIGPVDTPPLVPDTLYAWGVLKLSRSYRQLRKKLR
jgi:succinate-semialdehyde dehydrogenase/glutarate-semialdehyde dehydrogenase